MSAAPHPPRPSERLLLLTLAAVQFAARLRVVAPHAAPPGGPPPAAPALD